MQAISPIPSSISRATYCLALVLAMLLCTAAIDSHAVKSSDPQHGAKRSRLETIKNDLLPAQEQRRRDLQLHQEVAKDPDIVFVASGSGGPVVPMKRLEWRSRALDSIVAGKVTSEQAAKTLEEVEKFSANYKRELYLELNRVDQRIKSLNEEMNRLRADLNTPQTVAAAPPSPSAGKGVRMSELEYDFNRYGQDYSDSMRESVGSPEACRDRCLKDPKCRSFSWVRAGIQGNAPRCWLKHGVPGKTKNTCCVSGVKIIEQAGTASTPAPPRGRIEVISAVYGANCGRASDVSGPLRRACDNKQRCDYLVDHTKIGDPAAGCPKAYTYRWRCVGSEKYGPVSEQTVAPEASRKYASLWCS